MLTSLQKIKSLLSSKELKKIHKHIVKINELEEDITKLSNEELKNKTTEFKERIKQGEKVDSFLEEAFAIVRESAKRILKQKHFNVQLITGVVLHEGNVAEMKTGEGKTLASTLTIYINALLGEGVHVVTANEYLAKRDSIEMGELFNFLGLTVGLNTSELEREDKKKAYACDITYGTSSEFAFDYLRDNMVHSLDKRVQRGLSYAIIDEADSILIDEARTPLIISKKIPVESELYIYANHFVQNLVEKQDFIVDLEEEVVTLTDKGTLKAEKDFEVDNLYSQEHYILTHHIQLALQANYLMDIDVDYVVNENGIVIVDKFTGRLMYGRRFKDGLHQAIEVKENLEVKEDSITLASITIQNYFRMYKKLSGMTGTAKTEEEEFQNIYGMDVIEIPTNKPSDRIDYKDEVYLTKEAKYKAILEDIKEKQKTGQPILIGTPDIDTSEKLSYILQKQGILHYVLNANNHELEAHIISKAGLLGNITIATNMAGRGTDIKLGKGVEELGGLYIIGVEKHESRRIDNQLKGRTGRQGLPGQTKFYLSVEDYLFKRFKLDSVKKLVNQQENKETFISNELINKIITQLQEKVEVNNYNNRKHLLKFDDILNEQRTIYYNQRQEVLNSKNLEDTIENMIQNIVKDAINKFANDKLIPEEYEIDNLIQFIEIFVSNNHKVNIQDFKHKENTEIENILYDKIKLSYNDKLKSLEKEKVLNIQQDIVLKIADKLWVKHIENMDYLRQGISLRGYGEKDPVREFRIEGFHMFNELTSDIEKSVLATIINL